MITLIRHEPSEVAPLTNTCMMSPAESFLQVSAASGALVFTFAPNLLFMVPKDFDLALCRTASYRTHNNICHTTK